MDLANYFPMLKFLLKKHTSIMKFLGNRRSLIVESGSRSASRNLSSLLVFKQSSQETVYLFSGMKVVLKAVLAMSLFFTVPEKDQVSLVCLHVKKNHCS